MSKHTFTEQNLKILQENKYTYRVTSSTISFTKEFKTIFYEEYLKGGIPRQILEKYGYPMEVLGKHRIWGIAQYIKKEYEKYGDFHEGTLPETNTTGGTGQMASEEAIRHLQHEVDYLKQEMEFLKKISSIRITGK